MAFSSSRTPFDTAMPTIIRMPINASTLPSAFLELTPAHRDRSIARCPLSRVGRTNAVACGRGFWCVHRRAAGRERIARSSVDTSNSHAAAQQISRLTSDVRLGFPELLFALSPRRGGGSLLAWSARGTFPKPGALSREPIHYVVSVWIGLRDLDRGGVLATSIGLPPAEPDGVGQAFALSGARGSPSLAA
jgi:hypothetical protein